MYGARDNALGVAALLTLAKAFARLPKETVIILDEKPAYRSIVISHSYISFLFNYSQSLFVYLFVSKTQRKRSILFLVPTAEEQGLLGSFYFMESSLFSPKQIVACINFDILNIFGRMRDISFYGSNQNELENIAELWAKQRQSRVVTV
jgi:Zn-dependent M28 family amino/carboxypeptidase